MWQGIGAPAWRLFPGEEKDVAKYTEQIDAQIGQLLQTRGEVTADMLAGVTAEEARSFLSFYASSHPEHVYVFDGTALKEVPVSEGSVSSTHPGHGEPAVAVTTEATAAADATPKVHEGWTPEQMREAENAAQERGLGFEPAEQAGFHGDAADHVPDAPTGYRSIPPGNRSATAGNDPFSGLDITPEPRTQKVSGWLWLLTFFAAPLGAIAAWAIARDKNPTAARTMLVVGVIVMVTQACLWFALGGAVGGMGAITASTPTDTVWPANGHLTLYYFGLPG